MKRVSILATLLILTACAAAVESPTPSPSPTATAMLTPSATAIPSTTPSPTVILTPMPTTATSTAVPTLPACPGGALLYLESYGSYGDEILWEVHWVCPENSEDYLIASPVRSSNLAVSPAGDQVAFAGEITQIVELNSREITTLFEEVPEEDIFDPSWSPDGEYIIYFKHRPYPIDFSIEVVHLSSGTISEELIPDEYKEQLVYATSYLEWLPQGDQILVYGTYSLDLYVLDITCDDKSHLCVVDNLREIPTSRSIRKAPAVSPDGKLIAAICAIPDTHPVESSLCILDFSGNVINEYRLADIGVDYAYNLAWSPDGSRIAFDDSLRIYIFSLTDQSLLRFIRGINPLWLP